MSNRILSRADVVNQTGLKSRTVHDHVAEGTFPPPVQLTARRVGWVADEIDAWISMRIEHRDGKLDKWVAARSAQNQGRLEPWVAASVAKLKGVSNIAPIKPAA